MENGKWKMENDGRANFNFPRVAFCFSLCAALVILCISLSARAQNYPKEIRGYKVYKQKITVSNRGGAVSEKGDSEVLVEVGAPTVADVSLSGVSVEITPRIESANQSGAVDFVLFKDFRVGGFKVDVEEYKTPFAFEKNKSLLLPAPVKMRLATLSAAHGTLQKNESSADELTVTGTIFVFGRFKKFGFQFKRVVPIEVNLKIKNPFAG